MFNRDTVPSIFSSLRKSRRIFSRVLAAGAAKIAEDLPKALTAALYAQTAIGQPIVTQKVTFSCPSTAVVNNDLNTYWNQLGSPICDSHNTIEEDLDYPVDRDLLHDLQGAVTFISPADCKTMPSITLAAVEPKLMVTQMSYSNITESLYACIYPIATSNMPINNTECVFNDPTSSNCIWIQPSNTEVKIGGFIESSDCQITGSELACTFNKTISSMSGRWKSVNPYLDFTYSYLNNTIAFSQDIIFVDNNYNNQSCLVAFNGNATETGVDKLDGTNSNELWFSYDIGQGTRLLANTPACQSAYQSWLNPISDEFSYMIFDPKGYADMNPVNKNKMFFPTNDIHGNQIDVIVNRVLDENEPSSSLSSTSSPETSANAKSSSSAMIRALTASVVASSTASASTASAASSVVSASAASSSTASHASFSPENASSSDGFKPVYGVAIGLGGAALLGLGFLACKKKSKAKQNEAATQLLSNDNEYIVVNRFGRSESFGDL